jgi:hypothetical protein
MARHAALRASDADREAVAERLRVAAIEGRLDADELEQRLHVALRARTYGQLQPLLADLPGPPGQGVALRAGTVALVVAVRLVVLLVVATVVLTLATLAAVLWLVRTVVWLAASRRRTAPPRRRPARVLGAG